MTAPYRGMCVKSTNTNLSVCEEVKAMVIWTYRQPGLWEIQA